MTQINANPGGEKSRTTQDLLQVVLESLEDDKAQNVVPIDLEGKTSIADYMVVASGSSARQVGAISDHLLERVKHAGYGKCRVEGQEQGDWVVVDAGDVVIHIFRPEVRDFYNLEKLWSVVIPADSQSDAGGDDRLAV